MSIIIIYFTQSSCRPCQLLKPHLERFKAKYANSIVVQEVDAESRVGQAYASRWNVQGLPTLVFTQGKEMRELHRHTGFNDGDERKIEEAINRHSKASTNSGPELGDTRRDSAA